MENQMVEGDCCSSNKRTCCETENEAEVLIMRNDFNTLSYQPGLCINCEMCINVCPHGVFGFETKVVELVAPHLCMECGACSKNCPSGAIDVNSGVGCASAMIYAALTRKEEPICGGDAVGSNSCCC